MRTVDIKRVKQVAHATPVVGVDMGHALPLLPGNCACQSTCSKFWVRFAKAFAVLISRRRARDNSAQGVRPLRLWHSQNRTDHRIKIA